MLAVVSPLLSRLFRAICQDLPRSAEHKLRSIYFSVSRHTDKNMAVSASSAISLQRSAFCNHPALQPSTIDGGKV